MFFHDRIVSIKPGDKVLEIGPGGSPHDRADIFLDLDPELFASKEEAAHQRGLAAPLKSNKPIVYYDGKQFPFKRYEFDYVIATHVLEHVENIDLFLSELFRVGKMGYIEYPTIYYDFVYNIPVHPNFLKKRGNTIYWMKKSESGLNKFAPIQKLFFNYSVAGYTDLIDDLVEFMMEGFEWTKPLKNSHTANIKKLTWDNIQVAPKPKAPTHTLRQHIRSTIAFHKKRILKQIKGS